jgi:Family of unknown function (DUF6545)
MDDTSASYYTAGTIAVILLAYTTWRLWPTGDQANDQKRRQLRWPALILLGLIGVVEYSAAPATVAAINKMTGVANFAAVWVYCLVDALACSAGVLLCYWREPLQRARQLARRWIAAYATVIAVLIVLFALGDAPVEHRVDFDTAYARTPITAAFTVLYLVAYGWGATVMVAMTWRWSKVATRPWLRPGLRVLALGSAFGVAFTLAKLTAVFARMIADEDLDFLSSKTAPGLSALAVVLFAIGFALPASGERITRMQSRLRRWRDYRALYPLWTDLSAVTPGPATTIKLPRFDLEVRATARTSMIRDGQIALRPHINPAVTEKALASATRAGLEGIKCDAVVVATQIAAALHAKQQGVTFHADGDDFADHGGSDLASELQWLAEVSRAYARSPLVRAGAPRQPVGADPAETDLGKATRTG